MPKMGQSVEECTIVKWRCKDGDKIKKGDILFEIETEKAVLEVESFYEGTLLKVLIAEGQAAPVGATVAFIGQPGEPIPAVAPPAAPQPAAPTPSAAAPAVKPVAAPLAQVAPSAAPVAIATRAPVPAAAPGRLFISPRARALAEHSAISAAKIKGSGPNGRIVEKDVQGYLDAHHYGSLRISPAAKALAIKEKIDILTDSRRRLCNFAPPP